MQITGCQYFTLRNASDLSISCAAYGMNTEEIQMGQLKEQRSVMDRINSKPHHLKFNISNTQIHSKRHIWARTDQQLPGRFYMILDYYIMQCMEVMTLETGNGNSAVEKPGKRVGPGLEITFLKWRGPKSERVETNNSGTGLDCMQ